MRDSVIVIPARMASTRFPGKPLVQLAGKPMVQWVYERAVASNISSRVVVASGDEDILDVARGFGAEVFKSRQDHPTGTDRIAEFAALDDAEVIVNVQGDEPLMDVETIASVAGAFSDPEVRMSSAFCLLRDEEADEPSVVKVVTNLKGDAMYFSRHAIPYPRSPRVIAPKKHIGIYGYRRSILLEYPTWTQTPMELTESLEQLRILEHGIPIRMVEGRESKVAVDTPEQALLAERYLLAGD